MGKAKIKKHSPPSDTAANTLSCKPPHNGPCCVDLTSPVDWVSACQAGHWISRKPTDEVGSFAPACGLGWADAAQGTRTKRASHTVPCRAGTKSPWPDEAAAAKVRNKWDIHTQSPEQQNESLTGAGSIQHWGRTGPVPPQGLFWARVWGWESWVRYAGLQLAGCTVWGRNTVPAPHLPCANLQITFFPLPQLLCAVWSWTVGWGWHGLPMGDGVWSQPDVKGRVWGSNRGSGLHKAQETPRTLAKQW